VASTVTLARGSDPPEVEEAPPHTQHPPDRTEPELSRHRFTVAVMVGALVVLPPVLWLLWDLWSGTVDPLRGVDPSNFYDMQARAMFHGHLYLPNGRQGIEAFVHDGRQYTYFGIFPSLIRMPVLLITSKLDGKLTAPSLLLAWMTTALFSSLLLWRLRILMRGQAVVGRAEAASYGALMATFMGGSVVMYLTATPFIYNEDFAWSIPLTVGSLFALLGVMERPSWGRVWASAVLILCLNLQRTPTGYACTIAAVLVAGWFALGKGERSNRRWAVPVLLAGAVPFLVNCAVTYAKFGLPLGLPMSEQIWASVNYHRRYFLAANGGRAFSPAFLPSTLWAYFQPFGLRVSGLFPYLTPPTSPAAALNGAVLDQVYPTASLTATMPSLLLLGLWGLVTAFRPRALGRVRFTRVLLVGAAAASSGVLLWGYISQRYLGDLMPLVILASAIGLVDVWRRLEGRGRKARGWALGLLCVLAVYGVAVNLAVSLFPIAQWTPTQAHGFVNAEHLLSIGSVGGQTRTGPTLPYWGPAGQLFAANHCSGLYLSTGDDMANDPGQQIQHYTWLPVEQSPRFTQTIGFTFNRPERDLAAPVTLMTYGPSKLVLEPRGPGYVRLVLENSGTSDTWPPPDGWSIPIKLVHQQYKAVVTTDPNLKRMDVTWYGTTMLGHYLGGVGPAVIQTTPASAPGAPLPVVTVAPIPMAVPQSPMSLCRSLVGNR
jgi:hypothetical protein